MSLRYGELFAGYHGLGMGLQSVLGGSTAWFSEFDKAPSAILAHHWPDVPNHGDITKIDFTKVEPVDVLTGGFPCQDVSHAGRRAGLIRDGEGRTRSGLWGEMLRAITELRPRLVVAENVRGLLSAAADSDVEPCPWCLGDANGEPDMRALGAVLADLADVGYDAWWVGLRAADVGAAHGRFRVFIFATPQHAGHRAGGAEQWLQPKVTPERTRQPSQGAPADSDGVRRSCLGWLEPVEHDTHGCGRADGSRTAAEPETHDGLTLLPTPEAHLSGSTPESHLARKPGRTKVTALNIVVEHLLPTPACNDMGEGKTVDHWDAWTEKMQAKHGNGNGHGKSLAIEAQRLLPTPTTDDAGNITRDSGAFQSLTRTVGAVALLPTPDVGGGGKKVPDDAVWSGNAAYKQDGTKVQVNTENAVLRNWGDYAPAIARWETVIGRPAPAPTEPGPKGNPRLSAAFVEWLMGLPEGHVTGVDIPRNAQLKALGNGVVPQQSAAACRWWLTQIRSAAA